MCKRHYISIVLSALGLFVILPSIGNAQEDNPKNEYQKVFDEFNKSIVADFSSFKSKNDSIFYSFLLESWREYKLFKNERSSFPKPIIQPVTDTSSIRTIEITPLRKRPTMLQDTDRQLILNGRPANYQSIEVFKETTEPTIEFDFYGSQIEIPIPVTNHEDEANISNKYIANYFKGASTNEHILLTIDYLKDKELSSKLGGWGYIELLKAASTTLYNDVNTQVLFSWLALLNSGYDAKVGYSDKDIYLLVSMDVPVFYQSYFESNNKKYYVVLFEGQQPEENSLITYENDYPGEVGQLNLYFSELPRFKSKIKTKQITYNGQKADLSYDINLANYYQTYPECELSIYFPPPLSDACILSIRNLLDPLIANGTNIEKINTLLDFVQHAIEYETDEKQFGFENYFFAEETICYPYADCEDRTVLLSQLIKEFIGLKTIAIIYPGHVSLGISLEHHIDGAYVEFKKKRYYNADPTYIGAKLGMIMPEFENAKPEIIEF